MYVNLIDICNPKQWKTVALKNLVADGKYYVYGANGIVGKYNEYNHENETILIGCRGTCGIINISKPKSYINGNAMCLDDLNEELFRKKYIYYYLKNYDFSYIISGTTVPQITIQGLKKIKIKKIPLKEQDKIIESLENIDKLITLKKDEINKLDNLVISQFSEMFGDPELNDKGWIKSPMGNYMTVLTDFSANGSYEKLDSSVVMYDEPNYAYMVRTTDLENKDYKNNVKYITEEAYNILSKSKVYPNDIIMNKIGSAGKVYIMPDLGMPVSLGRNAFLFRYKNDIEPLFIYYLLKSDYGTNEISQYVRGAVTKTITKDDVRKIKIIVPPLEEQNKFKIIVETIDEQKKECEECIEKLEEIQSALMQEYFG